MERQSDYNLEYNADTGYPRRRRGVNWLPLLLIPLFLFLGLGGYQLYKNAAKQPGASTSNVSRNTNPNPQVGVGGAPGVSVSPTPKISNVPSVTPRVTRTISPSVEPTDRAASSDALPQRGVGGSGVIPSGAPNTGRGE